MSRPHGSDSVTCPNGHTHDIDDLDKVGMDYKCPECHKTVQPYR